MRCNFFMYPAVRPVSTSLRRTLVRQKKRQHEAAYVSHKEAKEPRRKVFLCVVACLFFAPLREKF